jgi:hypothetical protein
MGKRDRSGVPAYGQHHKRVRKRWALKVRAGGVTCWRCGGAIPAGSAWDLGHVDEAGRAQGFPARHPEHVGCNRATLTHAKTAGVTLTVRQAERPKGPRFGGLPDPDPANSVSVWSRHWSGPFNPRCPVCRRLGRACPDADDDG